MNIQVGAGGVRLPGFLNVDVRKVDGVDIVGDAADLRTIASGAVETVFGNAVFEHFYVGHHLAALREWKRLLAPDGMIIVIGLPDFATIADLYLKGAAGIVGDRFDLLNVYRYTHGQPEHATAPIWSQWRASEEGAPDGWLPQLHKCIFDAAYVRDLLEECGLAGTIFNYAYPREEHTLNLGFIAAARPLSDTSADAVRKLLARIPDPGKFMRLETLVVSKPNKPQDSLLTLAKELETARPRTFAEKVSGKLSKLLGRP
jgi:hypothetical protein